MTLIQRVELLADEVEKLGEGGGGDLSAYLTKDEASSTYETQSAASSALALKADVATTYTKTEVDSAIASGPEPVVVPLNTTTGTFPSDKRYIFEQHLPFKTSADTTIVYTFDLFAGRKYYYSAKTSTTINGSFEFNSSNGNYSLISVSGGGVIDYITEVNSIRYLLDNSHHKMLNNAPNITGGYDYYPISDNSDMNNYVRSNIYYRQGNFTSIANCPVSQPFYMIVENLNGNSNTRNQIIFLAKDPTCFYRRINYFEGGQSVFTDWYKFTCDTETHPNIFNSTTVVPSSTGTPTACNVPWVHIQKKNDITLLISYGLDEQRVSFSYSQNTDTDKVFYKGFFVNPSTLAVKMIVVELGKASGSDPTSVITLIADTTL